ncbi:DNA polymerase III subunits gamma and tau, partial [hydrothermal vent metagenome]
MSTTNEHYTVLARRYRPQTFEEVVGQSHVAQALQNAIRKGRVAHAYLFTGARGVGKTSMARILAKALNCASAVDGIPCHECDICLGIAAGNDVDVLEIDGASNRGIDDIRALRANVNIKSMRTEYKIYIIDEVHMLTKEAFNALLKTLEEPPPKVKFVFCTTEPNKVPDTILSRCQRFDFASVETTNIAKRLTEIAVSEGIQVAVEAVELIARRAAGSMRDSQSLFDQLLAFGGDEIGAEDVHRLMGTAADELLSNLVQAMINAQQAPLLTLLDQALSQGVRLGELVDQLINYFRDMMIAGAGADDVLLLGVSTEHRPILKQQAEQWGIDRIIAAMQIVAEARSRMQRVTFGRSLIELALIRVSLLENLSQLAPLIAAIKSGRPLPVVSVTSSSSSIPAIDAPAPVESPAVPEPEISEPVTSAPVEVDS